MQSYYRNKCEFTIGPSPDGKGASLIYHCQMSGSLCTKTYVCVFVLCHVLTLLPQIIHWDSELDHTEVSCWLWAACHTPLPHTHIPSQHHHIPSHPSHHLTHPHISSQCHRIPSQRHCISSQPHCIPSQPHRIPSSLHCLHIHSG